MVDAEIAEFTWTHTLKIGWGAFWRGAVGAVFTSFCLSFVIGAIDSLMHAGHKFTDAVMTPVVVVALVVGMIMGLRMALRNRYGDFHLVLVNDKGGESPTSPVAPPTPTSINKHLDALDRLAKLRDTGALTDVEFEAAKKSILNELSG
jgi:hypothetical protein